jgi:hypothetical protein
MNITNASAAAVRFACKNFHYSHSVPTVQYSFNVYNSQDEWCGVICFGPGATPHIATPYGLWQGEVLELTRVALNGKQTATSQCVAAALKELHRQAPVVKLVVSYADMDQGHFGTIYQATNWIYEGLKNQGCRAAFIVNGKRVHPKTAYSRGWRQSLQWIRENIDPDAEMLRTAGKHKYLYCFDKKLRKKLLKTAKPYPKKEGNL